MNDPAVLGLIGVIAVAMIGMGGSIWMQRTALKAAADDAKESKVQSAANGVAIQQLEIKVDGRLEKLLAATEIAAESRGRDQQRVESDAVAAVVAEHSATELAAAQAAPSTDPAAPPVERNIVENVTRVVEEAPPLKES